MATSKSGSSSKSSSGSSRSSSSTSRGSSSSTRSTSGGSRGGSQMTGTRDITFDLVSILYHALEGGETYSKYIMDAEAEGDRELVKFFEQCKKDDFKLAEDCKTHLSRYFSKSTGTQRKAA